MTPAQAARELMLRREAANNIVAFAEYIDVPGRKVEDENDSEIATPVETKLGQHHKLILNEFDACTKRVGGRLMIFCPPGSAKTTYASVVGPAHYLGANPGHRVGVFSYGDALATKMGRRTRGIIKQNRYNGIHSTELTKESASVNNFTMTNGSEYMASGIFGGVTGNRMEGVVIDDPIKGREQANSETIRDKTYEAYMDDILTRLIPGGWLILIQTRWHEDDLAGRILPESWDGESGDILCKDGEVWRVVCLQAECDSDSDPLGRVRGEYLWPEWFTQQHWNKFRSNARTWGSLFQQIPSPLDGDLFNPGMIQTLDALPAGRITWVRGWDLAATEGGGDWTVGLKLGRHSDGRYIIADVRRGQWGPHTRDANILTTAQADGRLVKQDMPQDPGAAGVSQIVAMGKLLVGFPMVFGLESGDKEVRAESFAAQVNVGNVYMMRGDWNDWLRGEYRSFPGGKWDDGVDAGSRAFARLLLIAGKMKISEKLLKRVRR